MGFPQSHVCHGGLGGTEPNHKPSPHPASSPAPMISGSDFEPTCARASAPGAAGGKQAASLAGAEQHFGGLRRVYQGNQLAGKPGIRLWLLVCLSKFGMFGESTRPSATSMFRVRVGTFAHPSLAIFLIQPPCYPCVRRVPTEVDSTTERDSASVPVQGLKVSLGSEKAIPALLPQETATARVELSHLVVGGETPLC